MWLILKDRVQPPFITGVVCMVIVVGCRYRRAAIGTCGEPTSDSAAEAEAASCLRAVGAPLRRSACNARAVYGVFSAFVGLFLPAGCASVRQARCLYGLFRVCVRVVITSSMGFVWRFQCLCVVISVRRARPREAGGLQAVSGSAGKQAFPVDTPSKMSIHP